METSAGGAFGAQASAAYTIWGVSHNDLEMHL